jgi:hypothetical protein
MTDDEAIRYAECKLVQRYRLHARHAAAMLARRASARGRTRAEHARLMLENRAG